VYETKTGKDSAKNLKDSLERYEQSGYVKEAFMAPHSI